MCVARKSGPGRENSVAVDWRDCAWSPRIVVQSRWGGVADPAMRDEGARPAKTAKPAVIRFPRVTKQSPISTLFYLNP